MKPSVLFWFYKDFDVCKERLRKLRVLNPEVTVFALYGGMAGDIPAAQAALLGLVDDFYAYPHAKDPKWKWKHGDQLIATWYKERGQQLNWSTLFVMQWDMLIVEPLDSLFAELNPDEILLSGYRPFESVSTWWPWAKPTDPDLITFKSFLKDKFDYDGELFACLFIVACLPRKFLQQYAEVDHADIGFLEYKMPSLAHIFGTPICQTHRFDPWWAADPSTKHVLRSQRWLNAVAQEVSWSAIILKIADDNAKKIFHPVFKITPRWLENKALAKLLAVFIRMASSPFVLYNYLYLLKQRLST